MYELNIIFFLFIIFCRLLVEVKKRASKGDIKPMNMKVALFCIFGDDFDSRDLRVF